MHFIKFLFGLLFQPLKSKCERKTNLSVSFDIEYKQSFLFIGSKTVQQQLNSETAAQRKTIFHLVLFKSYCDNH